jgi:hypothetical protein
MNDEKSFGGIISPQLREMTKDCWDCYQGWQSIILGYLQANLSQSLKLPGTQFMGLKPMPKTCVFQSIGYSTHMVYNRENLQKYRTVAPKKNTGTNNKGFIVLIWWHDDPMENVLWSESFCKTIGRHIWVPLQLRSAVLLHEKNTPKHVIGNENFTKLNNWDPN